MTVHVTVPGYRLVSLDTVYSFKKVPITLKNSQECLARNMSQQYKLKMPKGQGRQGCRSLKVSSANQSGSVFINGIFSF
jgi:hypothetical protein